ncbi:hypothetical protein K227x_56770 [Rubripirellula lacrimiformis]|uniref:THUMP-like domain-containing protein n=1 Tax=Rubripirellula lacrimiformis TaxID=1930273 RepID=A0A517NJE1_9BACT|nr:class I SAM-dependent methyltransferase [Rubripirellula lacrimiformis]QDT07251.1 hypothetical protein K227x_56770 [Rubripirellula lacrimiformis]
MLVPFDHYRDVLAQWSQSVGNGENANASTIARMRQQLGEDVAHAVISSAQLQTKARAKFGEGHWWVSEKSLQQATPWQVARLKAAWLGNRDVVDLCCGVGGDTMELARRGRVLGVDQDRITASMAHANLKQIQATAEPSEASTASDVCCDDACRIPIDPKSAVHIDPDRRGSGKRTTDPDEYQPAWTDVLGIVQRQPASIIKLAPVAAGGPNSSLTATMASWHRSWISLSGSVREQSLICGDAIDQADLPDNGRSAYRVRHDGSWVRFVAHADEVVDLPEQTAQLWKTDTNPGGYMIDPDASIRAAGLTIAYANRHGIRLLGKPSGFLTCDDPPKADESATSTSPPPDDANRDSVNGAGANLAVPNLAVVGQVVWSGSADDRKLRRELRSRNMYPETIKVRGTDHDPNMLSRRYRSTGDTPVTLWIGRSGGRVYAAITTAWQAAEPLPRAASL